MGLSYSQLQSLWLSAGGDPDKAVIMAAISMAESFGNPNAINDGSGTHSNEYSVGLWQVNTYVHRNYSVSQLKDPAINASEAVRIYKLQGLRAWGAYTDGRYKKYLAASQAAAGTPASPIVDDISQTDVFAGISTTTLAVGLLVLVLVLTD